jgi:hypothetical protein
MVVRQWQGAWAECVQNEFLMLTAAIICVDVLTHACCCLCAISWPESFVGRSSGKNKVEG